ncbi:MAG: VOC family protein [Myxococcota bacterium]
MILAGYRRRMHDGVSVHLSIDVPDLTAGLTFYGRVFGFVEKARPFPTMAVLDGGGFSVCLHEKPAGTESSPDSGARRTYARHWTPVHLDLHVPRLLPVLQAIREGGGTVEREFRDQGPRPTAFCADPFGNGFCVIAHALV